MTISRRELYAMGEPFGDSATRTKPGGRVYGGGGGGEQTSTTMPAIPDELKPLANLYVKQAEQIAQTPWQGYGGQRFADTNNAQTLGMGMAQDRALNGSSLVNAGSNYLEGMLKSGPGSATQNPYGEVLAGVNRNSLQPGVNRNSLQPGVNNTVYDAGVNTNLVRAGANQYAGENPYIKQLVSKAQQSVADNYNSVVKPQMESSMVNSGSFGNAGLSQMQERQQKAAGSQMADIATDIYGADYRTQQQLAESAIGRDMAAQQFNSGTTDTNLARNMQAQQLQNAAVEANLGREMQAQQFNSALTDSNINRDMQAQTFNSGLTDNNIARNMQAQQFNAQMGNDWAGRNDTKYQNYMGNNMQAINAALPYGNQAYTDAGQLLNTGNMMQSQQQKNLDFGYQQFQDAQNNPYKQLQATGGVVGQSMGQTTTTTGGGK